MKSFVRDISNCMKRLITSEKVNKMNLKITDYGNIKSFG